MIICLDENKGEIVVLLLNWRLRAHLQMFEMRKMLFITVILHLGCLATVLAESWKSYVQHETKIRSDLTWKEKVIEVLEELLGEKVRTPPAPVVEGLGRQLNQERTKPLWTDQHHKDWSQKYYRSHQRNKRNSIATSLGKIRQ